MESTAANTNNSQSINSGFASNKGKGISLNSKLSVGNKIVALGNNILAPQKSGPNEQQNRPLGPTKESENSLNGSHMTLKQKKSMRTV